MTRIKRTSPFLRARERERERERETRKIHALKRDRTLLRRSMKNFMICTAAPNRTELTDSHLLPPHSELAREKMWGRIHLIPLLQAEEDRDLVRRTWADKARERELLGKETRVYHSDR